MCFNQPVSFLFSAIGLGGSLFLYWKTKNFHLGMGIFYFFLMEFLQGLQYFWIDQCDNTINQFLTALGWIHICFQPYFSNMLVLSLVNDSKSKIQLRFMLKLCLFGGIAMSVRFLLGFFPEWVMENTDGFLMGFDEMGRKMGWNSTCGISAEWCRGKTLCTYKSKLHLAWSIPLASSTYFVPGMFTHTLLMFAPFLFLKGYTFMKFYGAVLFLSGPMLSLLISDDRMEQPAIWCFFSICQIVFMIFFAYYVDSETTFYQTEEQPHEEEKKEN